MSAIQSVIKYVEGFKKEDLVRTKLKSMNPQGRGDGVEMCASFDKGGIECLLYVLEDFAIAASSLNITTTLQHVEFFKKILGHGPSEKFKRLLAKNPNLYVDRVVQQQQQNQEGQVIEVNVSVIGSGFQALMKDFIKMYCTSTDSKGDLIEYLKSEECRKPMKAAVATHQDRIEELMRFSKMLEGSRPNLTEDEQKLILFRSFPMAWQINWNRTQVSPQSATVEKLMQYMNNEKEYADAEWKKNHKKKENNKGDNKNGYQGRGGRVRGYQGRGRGRGREGRGGRGQGRGDNERCRQQDGVTPMRNKIEAVLKLGRPTDKSQVRSFIGAVTFYKSMWPCRSHILAPLHELTGDIPFIWGPRQIEAFETMKAMIAADAMTTYPDLNLPFDIYTDASDYQLGAAILQNGKPIAYWSKKLTESQKNYNTTEKELLAIVMCVKEYHDILYGGRLNVFNDHKNLTFHTLSPPRVMRWKLFLEDYDINLTYVPGKVNVLADAFSRLPRMNGPLPGKNELKGKLIDWNKIVVPKDEQDVFFSHDKEDKDPPILPTICRNDDIEMIELFMNLPTLQEMVCPTTVNNIQQHQAADAALRQTALAYPNTFLIKVINKRNLICYRANPEVLQNEWKIYLPQSMIRSVIRWYHMILGHCGFTKVYNTIKARFHAERLSVLCREYVCPENCHMYKQQGRGYGKLPPRHANIAPWNEVCIDLIGPWEIVVNGNICVFKALTCIDPVTNLVELIRIQNKTMVHVAEQFENSWLSRYPRPNRCVHDNGTEFTGWTFVELLARYGIKDLCTAVRNPQANAICERMHQTIGDMLRVVLHTNPPQNMNDANQVMDNALATCMHAMRCSVSAPIGTTPGAMVYGRDMIMDVPLIANLETIRNGRQQMIDENLIKQNKRRIEHHFRVGDRVMQIVWNKSKLSERSSGPFRILATHTNGNITIQRTPTVTDTQSTGWFTPYKGLD